MLVQINYAKTCEMKNEQISQIISDVKHARSLSDYEAVDVLWVALIKAANLMEGENEHKRMLKLVEKIPNEEIENILDSKSVNDLIFMDPPLETVLSSPYERLENEKTKKAIGKIRSNRKSDPCSTLINLSKILKIIRNKRAHGFKSRSSPGDNEILSSARSILDHLCNLAIMVIGK